ncbi:MAG: biliverdin-producing heme oxygenase [Anaerolineales bacterium]|nr:biliverdin-producing heme oxygenase [Anaerolineales bacterium]
MFSNCSQPLSIRLKEGTRAAHHAAENTPFMRELFSARLPLDAYRVFLVQLYHIYTALETNAVIMQSDATLHFFYLPALFRHSALEEDLRFYYGDENWRDIAPLSATETYVQRIRVLSQEWPIGLVAHHYTRYLGDLSGGQAMKRIVAKMFHLASEQGLAFYNFPQIQNYTAFKNDYRARLDAMPIDDATAEIVVAEAKYAFELNQKVFTDMMDYITSV